MQLIWKHKNMYPYNFQLTGVTHISIPKNCFNAQKLLIINKSQMPKNTIM